MTGPGDDTKAEAAALWRRFRALEGESPLRGKELPGEALTLAAYAEGRLGDAAAERVEAWLAANPEAVGDLAPAAPGEATQAVLDRAMALVAAPDDADSRVVSFRRRRGATPGWRLFAARAAVAASLLVTGLAGFAMGSNVYSSISGDGDSSGELFDQPLGVFSNGDSAI